MKKYVEVDREPVVGDMVKIVYLDETVPCINGVPEYKIGDVLKIIDICEVEGYRYNWGKVDNDVERVLNRCEFVVVEESTEFTKSDLKPCMVVLLRNGNWYIVVQSEKGIGIVNPKMEKSLKLCDFKENLLYGGNEKYDIMKVYGFNKRFYLDSLEMSEENRELLFERIEQYKRDIKIKELQDKMREIEREMEELR